VTAVMRSCGVRETRSGEAADGFRAREKGLKRKKFGPKVKQNRSRSEKQIHRSSKMAPANSEESF